MELNLVKMNWYYQRPSPAQPNSPCVDTAAGTLGPLGTQWQWSPVSYTQDQHRVLVDSHNIHVAYIELFSLLVWRRRWSCGKRDVHHPSVPVRLATAVSGSRPAPPLSRSPRSVWSWPRPPATPRQNRFPKGAWTWDVTGVKLRHNY